MDSFIGGGERACGKILSVLFNNAPRPAKAYCYGQSGMWAQVPIPKLISEDARADLSAMHAKSSVDFIVHECTTTSINRYAVYVNGNDHNGDLKGRRDAQRYKMLMDNGYTIVVLRKPECPALFTDEVKMASFREVISGFDNPYNLL